MLNGIRIEICAGCIEDVNIASSFKEVDRIELNSHLEADGLTPFHDVFLEAVQNSHKQIFPMVRVKEGPFTADEKEKQQMIEEASFFLQHGAAGIVFGILNDDGTLDESFTKEMSDLIHSYHGEAVFHKAFDVSKDKDQIIRQLINARIDRILTSGSKPSSLDGEDAIAYYNTHYGEAIQFQPAGGVNGNNVVEILQRTGCTRFHMSLRSSSETPEEKVRHVLESIRHMKPLAISSPLTGEDDELLKNDHYENNMQ